MEESLECLRTFRLSPIQALDNIYLVVIVLNIGHNEKCLFTHTEASLVPDLFLQATVMLDFNGVFIPYAGNTFSVLFATNY